MADRFTQFEDKPWVSSYVPLPLKEIQANYDKQQEKGDKAEADYRKAKEMGWTEPL